MAKRRTKKQKKRTSQKRSVFDNKISIARKKERIVEFGYDQSLIKKDLSKTVIISVLILGIEIALYFWLFK